LEGEHEVEVELGGRDAGGAEAAKGGILKVRADVGEVDERHDDGIVVAVEVEASGVV